MPTTVRTFEDFESAVLAIVREREPAAAVDAGASLLDLPGFDSLAIADVVERIEEETGVEYPSAVLVPETFASATSLAQAGWPGGRPTTEEADPHG
jgi:acyl carrier protein